MKNFHVPLPANLDAQLRAEATRLNQPATALARQAIEEWLHQRHQAVLHQAIAAYATRWAGSDVDLDPGLEEAGVEHFLDQDSM